MLEDLAYMALMALAAWLGWQGPALRRRRQEQYRRPGYIDWTRLSHDRQDPRLRDVRRGYLSVRRARGLSGHGWLPRRPWRPH